LPGFAQSLEFLRRLGRLAFYIPQLSINVIERLPGIPPGALDLSLHGASTLVPERLGANSLKNLAQIDRGLLPPLSCASTRWILAEFNDFSDFYTFSKTTGAFPNITRMFSA
jgi:hypothetical protein